MIMPKKSNAKRSDGRIAVQIYLGKDENGKRKYKTVYGSTQKEANRKADEIRAMLGKGLDVTAQNDTFGTWCERWLKCKKAEVSAGHYGNLVSTTKHLEPLKYRALSDIRFFDVADIINNLAVSNPSTGKPASKKLLTDIKSITAQIFNLAIDNRIIDYNPAQNVKIPKTATKSRRMPIDDEQIAWIENTPHRAQSAAMLMLFAGLRRGEVVALTWNDINFDDGTLTVNKSVEYIANFPHIKPCAKTEAGNRIIPLPTLLLSYLRNQPRSSLYICPDASGKIMTAGAWRRMWESYMADLDIKYGVRLRPTKSKYDPFKGNTVIKTFTAHQLRHTYATMLYDAGVDILTAKELLGHKDIKTTLDIYTHLSRTRKKKSIVALDQFISCTSNARQISFECKSNASQAI